jgi:uncharacterized protein (DUF1501 family)
MNLSRRVLLKAGLGATQISLLARFGLWGGQARAAGDGPDRLLTLFVPGGWMPSYVFSPLSQAQIARVIPPVRIFANEKVFFSASDVTNLDGTGDQLSSGYQKLRIPRLWDQAALSAGQPDRRIGGTTPSCWAWSYYRLWENASVVHGVDARTAAHVAGMHSAYCGVPGDDFRSPSLQAYAAHYRFGDFSGRALPNVTVGDSLPTDAPGLRPEVSPAAMSGVSSAVYNLSERVDQAWAGLRNRQSKAQVDFSGAPIGSFGTNAIDDFVAKKLRALRGSTTSQTDALYQKLYESYQNVSKQLANDVVTLLERVQGVQFAPRPYWIPPGTSHFATDIGGGAFTDTGGTWDETLNLALRLLKADIATSVAVNCMSVGNGGFDTHNEGNLYQFVHVRAVCDVIGRLLGEMKATVLPSGRTLLDKTLVIVFSEFARTWPLSNISDHWPATSVVFAGGGINANRMIGTYDVDSAPPNAAGFNGASVDVQDGLQIVRRQPNAADVIHTALKIMGLNESDIVIPGGSGEILGLRV